MLPTDAEKAFIEEVGVFFEQDGLPRTAGRILGWLLICDPPQQSAQQLARALNVTKGSISTCTRMLVQGLLLEKVGRPGERTAYYQMRAGGWVTILEQKLNRMGVFREVAERGLELMDDPGGERAKRLREMHDLYSFFEKEVPDLIRRFRRYAEEKSE